MSALVLVVPTWLWSSSDGFALDRTPWPAQNNLQFVQGRKATMDNWGETHQEQESSWFAHNFEVVLQGPPNPCQRCLGTHLREQVLCLYHHGSGFRVDYVCIGGCSEGHVGVLLLHPKSTAVNGLREAGEKAPPPTLPPPRP